MILTTLSNSYKWNHMVFVFLWLDYLLLHNVHPCCNTLQNSFHGWIIPVICLSHIWVASTFWQLWAMLCTWVYRYFLETCFQFVWIYSRSRIAGSFGGPVFNFLRHCRTVSTAAVLSSTSSVQFPFFFSHPCLQLLFSSFCLLLDSHPPGYEVASLRSFDLYFLNDW